MPGEFIKVKCEECKNEQVIFSKPAGEVKCLVCGAVLAKNTGGAAEITAKKVRTLS
ncbi:MAG: 30S ribosomal protein S27e [Candidatus Aenigmarchaeota archaeon]|nr:30S ribosomal protein S27e [Candidatus Aenigmarchaeota archaeon]